MAKRRGPPKGGRGERVRVRTAKRRPASSTRWLERQLNDPYVAAARREGYPSRAAYKLIELDDRFRFLRRGITVLDLGVAPGGWAQVAAIRVGAGEAGGGRVVALDLAEMSPLPGVEVVVGDVSDPVTIESLKALLGGPVDVVLSDMAPAATGHRGTDHIRIVALVEAAAALAVEVLAPGGTFVAKVWQGGTQAELLAGLKRRFRTVRHAKPAASRAESAEVYLVALDFQV